MRFLMMIHTSYMANWRNFGDFVPVSVMAYTPTYFKGHVCNAFAPSKELFDSYRNGELSFDDYISLYTSELYSKDPDKLLRKLEDIAGYKSVVLVCTCKDYSKCHRSVIAEYLSNNFKYEVNELPNRKDGTYSAGDYK